MPLGLFVYLSGDEAEYRFITHSSSKMVNKESFIISQVPVHSQLRFPGYLAEANAKGGQGVGALSAAGPG